MQLQVKLINQRIVHDHSPFYVERHIFLPIYTAKTLSRYFSHTFPDPSLAAGASCARPARLILYFWRLLALHNPT